MDEDSSMIPVGIDLGTTFCAVAYLDSDGKPTTVRNAEGELTTPSIVFFDRDQPIVGREAVDAGIAEPERVAQFAKRDVGESAYEKPIRGERLPAEVVQALVLRKLKSDAELKLGNVTQAVVTVPAFFNEPCRKATMDAGRIAGINILDIINEPTAAAITYGVESGFLNASGESKQKEVILVFDLGGGTFDVTIMEIEGARYTALASAGDVYLGGIDWDRRLVDHIAEQFQREFGIDPRDDESAAQELLQKANQTKHSLTAREEINVFFNHAGHRLRMSITRSEFAEITRDLLDRTQLTLNLVLSEAKLRWDQITRVLLVGGSTRMPEVANMVEELSGLNVDRSLSPDEAVAHGAAIYAGLVMNFQGTDRDGMSVTNVSSHDLGVLGKEKRTQRKRRGMIIPRNTRLPTRQSRNFVTAKDNQRSVKVEIVEGGDDSGNNATPIGVCVVDGLPPTLPKNTPVTVTFEYATNGRLRIDADIPSIQKKATLTLNRAAGLLESEIRGWKQRIDDGFGDDSVPQQQQSSTPPAGEEIVVAKTLRRKLTAQDQVSPPPPLETKSQGARTSSKQKTTQQKSTHPQQPSVKRQPTDSIPDETTEPTESDWRARARKLSE